MKKRTPIKRHGNHYVYILKCKDGTYYVGMTNNLANRVKMHNNGRGAKYLKRFKKKLPAKLVFAKEYRYYKNAYKAEKKLKTYSKKKKDGIVKRYSATGKSETINSKQTRNPKT